ncbi:general secretion pathway protein H [Extensimonas vulgaris]|uniref:General secretion pathway protein H n=1 Tax=Extensimonas vulgaris TaxID=1031594 RepID=A0A369AMS8_9BURK|nr:general secretion pathway protein H [Extensimonas vulgaris]TWI38627.1 general secretion pathway protein H [Extensimonas vulgaris]
MPLRHFSFKTQGGFTLLELLVVIAIMALATAGVSLSLRDSGQAQLEREAERLAALLEAGRAQSRASGVPVRWRVLAQGGFRFEGLPQGSSLPQQWLDARTTVLGADSLLLGPEPLIAPQQVVLARADLAGPALRVATDGLHPFHVEPLP